jgi:hypothetical protein
MVEIIEKRQQKWEETRKKHPTKSKPRWATRLNQIEHTGNRTL